MCIFFSFDEYLSQYIVPIAVSKCHWPITHLVMWLPRVILIYTHHSKFSNPMHWRYSMQCQFYRMEKARINPKSMKLDHHKSNLCTFTCYNSNDNSYSVVDECPTINSKKHVRIVFAQSLSLCSLSCSANFTN